MKNQKGNDRAILLRASRSKQVRVLGPVGGIQLPLPAITLPEKVEVKASSGQNRFAPHGTYRVYTPEFYAKHPDDRNGKLASGWFCTCADFLFRGSKEGRKCKHIMAVARQYARA